MNIDYIRSEIEHMRRQILRQRKEIKDLQRAGIHTKSAEELLDRMPVNPFDLGSGKKISKGGANPASVLELPPRRRIASDGKFRDVAIVQVGESCVWILRAIARQVTTRVKTDWTVHLKRTWKAKVSH
jgi:hypothetical protein